MRRFLLMSACAALATSALLAPLAANAHGIQGKATKRAFGAIAYHRDSSSYGYSYDFASGREAKIEALKQCGHPKCEALVNFRSACAALAEGPKKAAAATGATRQEAETKALKRCASGECKLLAWVCTK